MKRLLSGILACLLILSSCFFAVGEEEEDELAGLDELTRKEVKAVDQWYQKAKNKKITAAKGQPLWAGKAVFACLDDERFVLSSEYVRDSREFFGLSSYGSFFADSLEEADLLVIICPKYKKVFTYTSGFNAYETDTLAYVIELKEKRLYGPYTLASDDPPDVVHKKGHFYGDFKPEEALEKLVEKWIETPKEKSEEAYLAARELEKAGSYFQAREKYLQSQWEDWRQRVIACKKSMPKTGVLWRNQNVKGAQATLTFQMKNAPKNNGFLARIYKGDTEAAEVFIQGNGKASVKLPAGKYRINTGMGRQWFGRKDAFGDDYEGDYGAFWFTEESNVLTLGAKKTVTIEMKYTEGSLDNWVDGKYWENKNKKTELLHEELDWEEFRR